MLAGGPTQPPPATCRPHRERENRSLQIMRRDWAAVTVLAAVALVALGLAPAFARATAVSSWGSQGAGPGQFTSIGGIVAAQNGDLYVSDLNPGLAANPARIQQFTEAGVFIRQWGEYGTGNGQMNRPFDLAID